MLGIKSGYSGRHRTPVAEKTSHKAVRRVGVPLVVVVAALFGFSSAASAAPVRVVAGDTFSALVRKHCGTSNWQKVAFPGRDKNLIYAGETIDLVCAPKTAPKPTTVKHTPAPAKKKAPAATKSTSTGWVNPLPGAALTSCYGWRWGSLHTGLDMDGYKGQPVRAAASGVVMAAGWIGTGYGREVFIYHGNNTWTHYAHLNGFAVHQGQRVSAGQKIAYVGNSGFVVSSGGGDGSHLHFNIARYGKTSSVRSLYNHLVNPAPVLRSHGVRIGC